jgi:hypothetical protein
MVSFPARALCLFAAPAVLAAAPALQAPYAAWRTLATAHYRIHYPPALADWAQDVAGRIEAIHGRVTALVGYQSPGPIQVLLADPMAEPNGLAVPLISAPHVVLWRTEPASDSPIGNAMSSWTEILLAHELTHIHHLTRPRRPPPEEPGLRSLFSLPLGPLLLKCPRWVSEGYATLMEGRITGSGRPHSAIRAAILRQWARAGKLPPYQALDRSQDYLGMSMAYLAGSAYLEWLERQRPDQPDILQRLWRQLAGSHRSFEASFQATFGFSAQDGYQRFQAEASHDALEWEARLKAQGLREGELWLRVPGGVADLGVSPGGGKLLARLETRRDAGLRVWDLAAAPRPAAKPSGRIEPFNAVADTPPEFEPPRLLAGLPSVDHQPPQRAEWVDDRTILFQLKRPDREGTLRPLPALWHPGAMLELHPEGIPASGRTLAPVHRSGRWVLELDGQTVPLPGQPAGRAWVDAGHGQIFAGCELDGVWNLVRIPYRSEGGVLTFEAPQRLTRTPAAAWNPAPTPDGRWLYYTSLDARGMEIRRLDLALPLLGEPPGPEPRILARDTVMPPQPGPGALPPPVPPPPSGPYRAVDNLWNHLAAGVSLTPSGNCYQLGASGSDLLGRLSWQALAGLGDGAGPRGAMLGASSAAWPWKPSVTVFSALERPSLQATAPAPDDRERRGGEWALAFDHLGATRFWVSPVAAWERVRPLAPAPQAAYDRGLAGLRAGFDVLWARGPWGIDLTPGLQGYEGSTLTPGGSRSWNALRAGLKLRLETPLLPVTLSGEQGSFRGNPAETFHLGGLTTTLVPESLDLARVEQPALPAYTATGDRFLRWRGELGGAVRVYGEGTALWDAGQARGPFQRVVGLTFAADTLGGNGSEQVQKRMKVQLGVHRPLDGAMKGRTVGTLTLMLRP